MSRALPAGLAALLLLACRGEATAGEGASDAARESCRVAHVVDGDTLHARCGGEKLKVRLLRIDTPERDEAGYAAAAAALREILGADPIELEYERPGVRVADEYGRLLAYVRVRGALANVEMVRQGWSPFWTRYGKGRFAEEFRSAEREARQARRGIWADAADAGAEETRRRGIDSLCRDASECCQICGRGTACGDACISAGRDCHQDRGCACDAEEVCESR